MNKAEKQQGKYWLLRKFTWNNCSWICRGGTKLFFIHELKPNYLSKTKKYIKTRLEYLT